MIIPIKFDQNWLKNVGGVALKLISADNTYVFTEL